MLSCKVGQRESMTVCHEYIGWENSRHTLDFPQKSTTSQGSSLSLIGLLTTYYGIEEECIYWLC